MPVNLGSLYKVMVGHREKKNREQAALGFSREKQRCSGGFQGILVRICSVAGNSVRNAQCHNMKEFGGGSLQGGFGGWIILFHHPESIAFPSLGLSLGHKVAATAPSSSYFLLIHSH